MVRSDAISGLQAAEFLDFFCDGSEACFPEVFLRQVDAHGGAVLLDEEHGCSFYCTETLEERQDLMV